MNLLEYQEKASRTCPDLGDRGSNIHHMTAGLFTEFGELLDVYKKNLAYKKPVDEVNVAEEWGDFMWYLVNLARFYEVDLVIDEEFISKIELLVKGTTNIEKIIPIANLIYDNDGGQECFTELLSSWYAIAKFLGIDTEKALYNNLAKLKVRFPDKFSEDAALNRDLIAERKELEN